jgi:replicative DNA helicase
MDDLRLPTAVDDERFVIGSALQEDAIMHDMRPVLDAEDFALEKHRIIWQTACKVYDAGGSVDKIMVYHGMDEAQRRNTGGLSTLAELIDGIPLNTHLENYVKRLKEKAALRRLMLGLNAIILRASMGDTARELIDQVSGLAAGCALKSTAHGLQSAQELVDEIGISQLLAPRRSRGLLTPWDWMNYRTNGFLPAELWVLAAHTGAGKTSAALQHAIHAARRGTGTAIFSLEVGKGDLFQKAVCQVARFDSERLNSGEKLEPDERDALRYAANELVDLPLYFDTTATTTTAIHAAVRQRQNKSKIGHVIVDYLQLLGNSGRHDNRAQAVGANAWALKMLATDFQIPVLLLSQLTRESNKPGKQRRPELSDLKESGDIENHANGVWFIHRESQEDADLIPVDFILAKQRSGRRNVYNSLYFMAKYQRFEEKLEA